MIVINIGRWHECDHILRNREFRTHKSPIVYTEDGWRLDSLIIHHCPFCGEELPKPSYSMARMDASPW